MLAGSPASRSYWLSADGELTSVFAATVPDPGLVISTRVLPLANGTLAQSGDRSATDISKEAKLKGVVSFSDPVSGVAVLSSRGGSLPMYAGPGVDLNAVETGSRVEVSLKLDVPDPTNFSQGPAVTPELPLRMESMRALSGPGEIEMTGTLGRIDPVAGVLSIAADSTGQLTDQVELQAPEELPFESLRTGRPYSVTATRVDDSWRIVGLSPASGKAAANDPARAYGTHLSR